MNYKQYNKDIKNLFYQFSMLEQIKKDDIKIYVALKNWIINEFLRLYNQDKTLKFAERGALLAMLIISNDLDIIPMSKLFKSAVFSLK